MTKAISKERKEILGFLIRLEREKLKWTKNQMTLNSHGENVCSVSTLYRIEKGTAIQRDEIYFDLIGQFNRTYNENNKLDKIIEKMNKKFMHYFETLETEEAHSLLTVAKFFSKNQNFYYHQIFTGYLDMLLVNLNQKKLNAEEYHYYQEMMKFMPEPYNVLLLHLCFCHAHNFIQQISEIAKYEVLLKRYQNYLVIQIDSLLFLRCMKRIFEYQQVHLKVMEQIRQRGLINQEAKVLGYYLGVIAEIQKTELNTVLNELEQFLKNNKLKMNHFIYNNVLSMLAMVYYVDVKNYNKAYQLFEKLLQEDVMKVYIIGLYYFSSCELSDHEPASTVINRINPDNDNVYLRYFFYKYVRKWNNNDLVNYLKTDILNELKRDGNQLKINVFKNQWNLLQLSANKFYKDYYKFIKNFE